MPVFRLRQADLSPGGYHSGQICGQEFLPVVPGSGPFRAQAQSRRDEEAAGRKAVEAVLLNYGLLETIGHASTDIAHGVAT